MEKQQILESLGFSKEYLDKINQFNEDFPQIVEASFASPVAYIDYTHSQGFIINEDPQTAYSDLNVTL